MICMGLDLGIETGFAFGEKTGRPHFGTFKLAGFSDNDRPRSMGGIYSAVLAFVRGNNIEGVAIESPLHLGGRSSHTERSLTMLSGAAQAGAINGGAKTIWLVGPSTWRKAVLGHGFPDDPKGASVDYCKLVLKVGVANHNAAEALCIMGWAHAQARLL